MTKEELEAWKVEKKTEAYEELIKRDPTYIYYQEIYTAKLKAIDQIQ